MVLLKKVGSSFSKILSFVFWVIPLGIWGLFMDLLVEGVQFPLRLFWWLVGCFLRPEPRNRWYCFGQKAVSKIKQLTRKGSPVVKGFVWGSLGVFWGLLPTLWAWQPVDKFYTQGQYASFWALYVVSRLGFLVAMLVTYCEIELRLEVNHIILESSPDEEDSSEEDRGESKSHSLGRLLCISVSILLLIVVIAAVMVAAADGWIRAINQLFQTGMDQFPPFGYIKVNFEWVK
jgi:hypothetical protein